MSHSACALCAASGDVIVVMYIYYLLQYVRYTTYTVLLRSLMLRMSYRIAIATYNVGVYVFTDCANICRLTALYQRLLYWGSTDRT